MRRRSTPHRLLSLAIHRGSPLLAALLWGGLVPVPRQVAGQIVINEILKNPAAVPDSLGEWIELYNAGTTQVDLRGWTLADSGSDQHLLEGIGPLLLPPGGYWVLGRNADPARNGGYQADYRYADFVLGNGADEVLLLDGEGGLVDQVAYRDGGGWPDPEGASLALRDPGLDNALPSSWRAAEEVYGAGDRGTPGRANGPVSLEREGERWPGETAGGPFLVEIFPNPFRSALAVRIRSRAPAGGGLREGRSLVRVFDLRGRAVRTLRARQNHTGEVRLIWDGTTDSGEKVPEGTYLLHAELPGAAETRRVLVAR